MLNTSSHTKKILITGGTSGLGLELANCFLKKGYEVVTTGRIKKTISDSGKRFTSGKLPFASSC